MIVYIIYTYSNKIGNSANNIHAAQSPSVFRVSFPYDRVTKPASKHLGIGDRVYRSKE